MQRSFYYWKTVFALSPTERQTLRQLSVQRLYVKFFDVEWNNQTSAPQPVAKSLFREAPPAGVRITPVVFITLEPLRKANAAGLNSLAASIATLLSSLAATNHVPLTNEVQVDCDWTATTKDAYFHLLTLLKKQPFFRGKIVSATIRLHQVKFFSETGVPPVDKGLLMCYNMGNLRDPRTANSIIDKSELKKYIAALPQYPLPLDAALPLFNWYVLFDGNVYKGLLRDFYPGPGMADLERVQFSRDTVIDGHFFARGQWLRHERSDAATVGKCAELLGEKWKGDELTLLLYSLDERYLSNYQLHELERFYTGLR